MPLLDVSFVLDDPMFSDNMAVTRRTDTIDAKGRTTPTTSVVTQTFGVVTQESPADLMRRDDGQMMPRKIFVASRYAFRGVSPGFQPDVISWPVNADGSARADTVNYTVTEVLPYSRYGAGFHEVVAQSGAAVDNPQ